MSKENTKKVRTRGRLSYNNGLGTSIICLIISVVFYFLAKVKIIDGASIGSFLNELTGIRLFRQVFEAAFIMLLMISLAGITKFIVSKINPKSNRANTLLEVIYSAANYVYIIVGIIMVLLAFDTFMKSSMAFSGTTKGIRVALSQQK